MGLVLVASDLHLSPRIWKHQPIEGDSYWSWVSIVKLAIARKVEAVVLAGDLLDKQHNGSEAVSKFVSGLQALLRNKIKVFFTQGQHEYQEIPWASLATGCQHVHKKAFQICGVNFYGLDYMPEAELQEAIKQIPPETTVMVMHQVWADFMGDIAKPQGSFKDLPDHVSLLITGDFHETHNFTTDDGLTVLSPGSSHLRSVSEPEDKHCFILSIEQGEVEKPFGIETIWLPTRRIIHYEVTDDKSMATVVDELTKQLEAALAYALNKGLPAELRTPLLRVTYTVGDIDWQRQITEAFGEKAHLFFKLKVNGFLDREVQQHDLTELGEGRRIQMQDCLPECIQPEEDPEAYELASLLIGTDGKDRVKEVLTTWFSQKMTVTT